MPCASGHVLLSVPQQQRRVIQRLTVLRKLLLPSPLLLPLTRPQLLLRARQQQQRQRQLQQRLQRVQPMQEQQLLRLKVQLLRLKLQLLRSPPATQRHKLQQHQQLWHSSRLPLHLLPQRQHHPALWQPWQLYHTLPQELHIQLWRLHQQQHVPTVAAAEPKLQGM